MEAEVQACGEGEPALEWPPGPAAGPALGAGEIHVWAGVLGWSAGELAAAFELLSTEERARAERFHFEHHRTRYIASHAMLRALLARYTRRDPRRLDFVFGERGKPELGGAGDGGVLRFNMAHSGGVAMIGLTRAGDLGVDLEQIRPFPDDLSIAANFFSPSECAGLRALPAASRARCFFNLWTRKEAWLKATGEGIGESLAEVEVSFLEGEPPRVTRLFGSVTAAREWALLAVAPSEQFAGAVAIRAQPAGVCCWKWTGFGR